MSTPPPGTNPSSPSPDGLLMNLMRKVDTLEDDVRGNGDIGLKQRMSRAESHLYANPKTNSKGLVADVEELKDLALATLAQVKLLNWILGTLGVGSLITGGVVWLLGAGQ